ncbi:protein FAM200C-like [Palaemon carinicauda]|uniref:protein FAM200C-like n=1 Tax=Palaemon carinicauda TaxID=392227 RepID=UPI0035B665BF
MQKQQYTIGKKLVKPYMVEAACLVLDQNCVNKFNQIVSNFFEEENLLWSKLVGVCTDGALSIIGFNSVYMTLVETNNPGIIKKYCLIHREALVSKTLPDPLEDTLEIIVKRRALITRIFCRLCQDMYSAQQDLFYKSVCWLLKDNVLVRVFEFLDELQIFLTAQVKKTEQLLNDIQGPFE